MKLKRINEVVDVGNDVLVVVVETEDGELVKAFGWVSATEKHYPPEAYDEDGHLPADAEARAMTKAEVGEYARRLAREQLAGDDDDQDAEEPAPPRRPIEFT